MPTDPVDTQWDEPVDPGDDSPAKQRGKRPGFRLVLAALAVAVAAGLLLPGFSVTQPGYYSRYPGLRTRMDNWARSTHAKMSCVACHIEPGTGAFVVFAARAVPEFYSQLLQGPRTTNLLTAPGTRACRKCHTKYREVAASGDLIIPHRAHVEVLNLDCGACHKFLVHVANRNGFNRPEMEGCVEKCHDGDTATDACVKCHTEKSAPVTHRDPLWLQMHGKRSRTENCDKCHNWTPDYCSDCHSKRPASHAGNWKTDHSVPAKRRSGGCLVCHDKVKFCGRCH